MIPIIDGLHNTQLLNDSENTCTICAEAHTYLSSSTGQYLNIVIFHLTIYRIELTSKYFISILIIIIVFMYATHEVYSLDMSTRVI